MLIFFFCDSLDFYSFISFTPIYVFYTPMYAVFITFIRIILRTLHTCFFALFGHNSVIRCLLFCVIFLFKLKELVVRWREI